MADYDAIVIGAGHNGLAAASVLAKNGLSVLVLEKTNWPGGMAGTKELFKGYKHSVGAWALLIFREEMMKLLELERYGLELITPRDQLLRLRHAGGRPLHRLQRQGGDDRAPDEGPRSGRGPEPRRPGPVHAGLQGRDGQESPEAARARRGDDRRSARCGDPRDPRERLPRQRHRGDPQVLPGSRAAPSHHRLADRLGHRRHPHGALHAGERALSGLPLHGRRRVRLQDAPGRHRRRLRGAGEGPGAPRRRGAVQDPGEAPAGGGRQGGRRGAPQR